MTVPEAVEVEISKHQVTRCGVTLTLFIDACKKPKDLDGQEAGKLPEDLLEDVGGGKLHKLAARAWQAMKRKAKSEGVTISAVSGQMYRSYDEQADIFIRRNEVVEEGGREWNGKFWRLKKGQFPVAVPGRSNHNWGLAVDLQGLNGKGLPEERNWNCLKWLVLNCRDFGFSWEALTKGKEEPWHIRYVAGDEVPKALVDDAMCDKVRVATGGELPAELAANGGRPTNAPAHGPYRRMWRQEAGTSPAKKANKAVGSPIQGCPKKAAKTKSDPAAKCRHGELKVVSGGRSVLIADHGSKGPQPPAADCLEVVAGPDIAGAKNIEATLQIHAGPCATHEGRTMAVGPVPFAPGSRGSTKVDFRVACAPLAGGLADFLPLDPGTVDHTVTGCSCGASAARATVKVFPELSWKGDVSWQLQKDWQDKRLDRTGASDSQFLKRLWDAAKSDGGDGKSTLLVAWNVKRTLGTQAIELGQKFDSGSAGVGRLTKFLGNLAEFFFHSLASLTGTVVALKTGVKLGFEWGWKEAKDHTCHFDADLSLELSPLFGIKVGQDVTDAFLALLVVASEGALAGVVDRVKRLRAAAARGYERNGNKATAKGVITLTCEGEISAKSKLTGRRRNQQWQAQGADGAKCSRDVALAGKVAVELTGELSGNFEAQGWFTAISLAASLSSSARAELTASDCTFGFEGDALVLGVKLKFGGLVLKEAWLFKGSIRYGARDENRSRGGASGHTKGSSAVRGTDNQGNAFDQSKETSHTKYDMSSGESGVGGEYERGHTSERVLVRPRTWDFTQDKLVVFRRGR